MTIRVSTLTLDTIDDLPAPCRSCVVWEYGKRASDQAVKDEWVSAVLLDWGSCGRVAYVDDVPAGYAMYARPRYLDGGMFSMTAVSADAVLLTTLLVLPQFRDAGIGRLLVQAVAKDAVRRRGVRAVEAFGDQRGGSIGGCVAPADFLGAVGFKTVRPHPRYPRMRLDLRSLVWWRGEMGDAIERWLGAIRPEKGTDPVGVNPSRGEPVDGRT
jgi:GNAT superfamily N-acetyltransferase